MKVPPEDFLRALLHDETATAATIDTETASGEATTKSGTVDVDGNASANASVSVNVVVVLVVKGKFTHEDVDELTGAFTRFDLVLLLLLLDDERFADAAVVRLEASVDNFVTAIQTLNLIKIGKSLLFHPLTIYSNIAPSDLTY